MKKNKNTFDVDIDFGDRSKILDVLPNHVSAAIMRNGEIIKHNTGVYFTDIPKDPICNICTIDHKEAEARGYLKFDLLNVNLYNQITDEAHLDRLMTIEPDWNRLAEESFTEQLIHISNYTSLVREKMPSTIPQMAMFLAAIRPAKRHLIHLTWKQMNEKIWDVNEGEGYQFRKSHAIAYACLVKVHMNLLNGIV